jgi:hypothetical protein
MLYCSERASIFRKKVLGQVPVTYFRKVWFNSLWVRVYRGCPELALGRTTKAADWEGFS